MTADEKRAQKILMKTAPAELEAIADKLSTSQRRELAQQLQHVARWAAFAGIYFDERHGYGCGDQGHRKAVKKANQAARKVWTKALGFNAFYDFNI